MKKYYLSIDIGASSGRHILGSLVENKLVLEEIYRFPNGFQEIDGVKVWDIDAIFFHVIKGIQKCVEMNRRPISIGIDTWGLDFVLLDENDQRVGNVVTYRDDRTKNIYDEIFKIISKEDLYNRTGIQMADFNTLCQLFALKREYPEEIEQAKTFLMIPDYLNFLLTGIKKQEYTNATTTQLMNAKQQKWDLDLIHRLGIPTEWFQKISPPGQVIGRLKPEIAEQVGFDSDVVLTASHDTASALMAVSTESKHTMCISSGTWSLVGMEIPEMICNTKGLVHGFTNEGGYEGVIDFLKNSMGLWMIQQIRAEHDENISFEQICNMAENAQIESVVDVNDRRFLGPDHMSLEVQEFCKETNQEIPQTFAQLARVVYRSIAYSYDPIMKEIERIQKTQIEQINIFGGGSNADYLNRLTAQITGKTIIAGPSEATVIGNIICQMIAKNDISCQKEGRDIVSNSFDVKIYQGEI